MRHLSIRLVIWYPLRAVLGLMCVTILGSFLELIVADDHESAEVVAG